MHAQRRIPGYLVAAVGFLLLAASVARSADEPWAFAVVSDSRPGKYRHEDGLPGLKEDLLALKKHYFDKAPAERPAPEFLIMPGDIDPPQFSDQLISEVLGKDFPWFPVLGNHDVNMGNRRQLRGIFDKYRNRLRLREGPVGTAKLQYSATYKNVLIVVLNVYWDGTDGFYAEVGSVVERRRGDRRYHVLDSNIVEPSRKWAEGVFSASKARYKIITGHEPAWPFYRYWDNALGDHPEARDRFWKMLGENNVHIYFTGHTHYHTSYQWLGNRDPNRWKEYTSKIIPGPVGTWQINPATTSGTVYWEKRKSVYDRSMVYCRVTEEAIEVECLVSLRSREAPGEWGEWCVPENGQPIYKDAVARPIYRWKIYPDIRKNLPNQ